jgi:hypothetical protein
MRKLPRRLPSNSPSLAWVAFAVLLLSLGGGLAGLYTHRQNQEAAKGRQLVELRREVEVLREKTAALTDEFSGRVAAAQLKLAVGDRKLALSAITPERRVLVAVPDEVAAEVVAAGGRREAPGAAGAGTAVMATVSRP